MNILIVGCGRVGSELAGILSREGHDISVVDRSADAFALLPEDFSGYCTAGVPIDQDVLRQAGIENCDALAAVSPDDNVNIMVCQLAREMFHVDNLIARINDPRRENVFSHFGLRTICPTNITVDNVKGILMPEEHQQMHFGSHTVSFRNFEVPKRLYGTSTADIDVGSEESLFAVRRADYTFQLLSGGPVTLQAGDWLIICSVID
ncbi:MAG: potassium channel family protein [Candidatus Merdivicinus sp.]|jgi:trk system potassium uptake protein TrkA